MEHFTPTDNYRTCLRFLRSLLRNSLEIILIFQLLGKSSRPALRDFSKTHLGTKDWVIHAVSYCNTLAKTTYLTISILVQTQHLLGLGVFTRVGETEARGDWQVRARHVRVVDNGATYEWDSSSFVEFTYLKVEGEWKLGGIRPHTVVANTGKPEEVIGQF